MYECALGLQTYLSNPLSALLLRAKGHDMPYVGSYVIDIENIIQGPEIEECAYTEAYLRRRMYEILN